MLAARVEEKLTGVLPAEGSDESLRCAPSVPAVAGRLARFSTSSAGRYRYWSCFRAGVNILATIGWLIFGFGFPVTNMPTTQWAIMHCGHISNAITWYAGFKALAFGAGVTTMMLIPVLQFAAMPARPWPAQRGWWVDDRDHNRA